MADKTPTRKIVIAMAVLATVLIAAGAASLALVDGPAKDASRATVEAAGDGLGLGEPNYRRFQRAAADAMELVEPFPSALETVERWEDCGHGADPLCGSVVLLVDDTSSDVAPVEALGVFLESRGWRLDDAANIETRYSHPDGGVAMVEDLAHRSARGATWLSDGAYVSQHGAEGIAYLEVVPPGY